jgi:hypothetical protein
MAHNTHNRMFMAGALVALGLALVVPGYAFAQGLGIKVQPTSIDERLDAGNTVSGEITVTNEMGGEQTYYIGTRNITTMDEVGRPVFADDNNNDENKLASWIVPRSESITVDVGETVTVPYTITVPENASPGSHFAALFVTREPDLVTESGAGVGFQVATLVHLRVNGDAVEEIAVREFSTNQTLYYNNANVTFTSRIENTGTVYERPQGIISITNMLGQEVKIQGGILKLVDDSLREQIPGILPDSERLYSVTWSADDFAIGRYSALLSVVYGETSKFTISDHTVTFWVLPLKEIGLFVGSILSLVLVVALMLRAYIRRALAKAGVHPVTTQERERIETLPRRILRVLLWFTALTSLLFIAMLVYYG